jgi:hypothetical protein
MMSILKKFFLDKYLNFGAFALGILGKVSTLNFKNTLAEIGNMFQMQQVVFLVFGGIGTTRKLTEKNLSIICS